MYLCILCVSMYQSVSKWTVSYCGIITKLVYPPELSRMQDFVLILIKIFGGGTPDPPFKQNYLRLYYNHNTAKHLKKLKTHTQISPPPPHFSGELKIKWSLYVLFDKSIVDHFFTNGCLKEQRKVLENSLKIYFKSPWKRYVMICGNHETNSVYWLCLQFYFQK